MGTKEQGETPAQPSNSIQFSPEYLSQVHGNAIGEDDIVESIQYENRLKLLYAVMGNS